MKYKNFDLEYEEHLRKLTKYADKIHPNRRWFADITLWDDTDYKIGLQSSWGLHKHFYGYKKSPNKYYKISTTSSMEENGYTEIYP